MNNILIWFYKFNDNLAKRHRAAYEKSLNSNHAVKVHSGNYYYKGYSVDFDGERCLNYQWGFELVSGYPEDKEFCKTKKECLISIDALIEYENSK